MSDTETATAPEAETPVDPAVADPQRGDIVARLTAQLGDGVVGSHIVAGRDVWVRVANGAWAEAAATLRHSMGFQFFTFLSAIDWMPSPFGRYLETEGDTLAKAAAAPKPESFDTGYAGGTSRFQVFARVTNLESGLSVTVKADTDSADQPTIASWTPVYAGADWHEREAWEMYGIEFVGHPGLRHIYLPGSFEGHPLRKDFPLLARVVRPWPGIVDVEPMPERPGADDAGEGAGGETTDGTDAGTETEAG